MIINQHQQSLALIGAEKLIVLLKRHCRLIRQDNDMGYEWVKSSIALSSLGNYSEEPYYIFCTYTYQGRSELVFTSYGTSLPMMVKIAERICADEEMQDGIEIRIFKSRGAELVCKSSPAGLIFI